MLTYPQLAVCAKRGYDRNTPIWVVGIFFAIGAVFDVLLLGGWITNADVANPTPLMLAFLIPYAVFGLALRRLGDWMRAEDAVQETFAAIWRSAGTYRPERGPGAPWLYAVARNAIVDRARGRSDLLAEVPDTASLELGPHERVETSYVSWRVHRALEELPRNERDVIELAYYGGLSQSEVADFLGIPLGTVKTRTRSALGRLAGVLEGDLA